MNVNFTSKFFWEDTFKYCSAEHIYSMYLHKMLLEYLYYSKYDLKRYLDMDLRIFLNIWTQNLSIQFLHVWEIAFLLIFVEMALCIWGDVSFLYCFSYRSFKPALTQSSPCNEKTGISYDNLEWIYVPRTVLTEAICGLQTLHN